MRTLDIFVSTLVDAAGRIAPREFLRHTSQDYGFRSRSLRWRIFSTCWRNVWHWRPGTLKLELHDRKPRKSIIGPRRRIKPSTFSHRAARGRCSAAHFGTYDYTAACNITAAHQHMLHPACDFARHSMQVAFGGTGVWLSDGATNIMPVAPHRARRGRSTAHCVTG